MHDPGSIDRTGALRRCYRPGVFDVSGWRHRGGAIALGASCRPAFVMAPFEKSRAQVGLPPRPILWTLDQVADMVAMSLPDLERKFVWFAGRNVGPRPLGKLLARNIAANAEQSPNWRVAERELVRWLKNKGFRPHDRGFIVD